MVVLDLCAPELLNSKHASLTPAPSPRPASSNGQPKVMSFTIIFGQHRFNSIEIFRTVVMFDYPPYPIHHLGVSSICLITTDIQLVAYRHNCSFDQLSLDPDVNYGINKFEYLLRFGKYFITPNITMLCDVNHLNDQLKCSLLAMQFKL